MEIRPIAHVRSDFPSKFGIPRQSGIVPELVSYVVFEPECAIFDALRGLNGYNYIWLIWEFSGNRHEGWVSGDVFIDVGTVADNAAQYGATRSEEMLRVIVHGLLHLCGQKDKTPRTNAQMHRKEDRYLALYHSEE